MAAKPVIAILKATAQISCAPGGTKEERYKIQFLKKKQQLPLIVVINEYLDII
uniref:MMR_HSR1_C domain-containing protein n=1 Tax=Heterorhabditis bacteriophora TaxID=37862 RepID=A0A1I7X8Q4_HETBA